MPEERVKTVIIGEKYSKYIQALKRLGIDTISAPKNSDIDPAIAFHADMSVFHAGGNDFFVTESNRVLCIFMQRIGVNVHSCEKCGPKYPDDVKTNCCIVGKTLFYNEKGTSRRIIEYAESKGFKMLPVKQGYVKCSICVLDENHIATEDCSIADAAERHGISVLKLDNEGIILEGYDKGFIGGASGKISRNELILTGRLETDSLERYAEEIGISITYLTDEPAQDIGSIIPITY